MFRAQIHGRIKKGILDGYPSSALPWLPEDPSDILSIFPFLSDRVFEPLAKKTQGFMSDVERIFAPQNLIY
jgi:hypothetical protein